MQLNQATDYAFRIVLFLSDRPSNEILTAQVLADTEGIPMRFLLKIMRLLVKAGIVISYRGATGGFSLAKKPAEISLLDVVEAIEGPITINRCFKDHSFCNKNRVAVCPVHRSLGEIQRTMISEFQKYNFADLLKTR